MNDFNCMFDSDALALLDKQLDQMRDAIYCYSERIAVARGCRRFHSEKEPQYNGLPVVEAQDIRAAFDETIFKFDDSRPAPPTPAGERSPYYMEESREHWERYFGQKRMRLETIGTDTMRDFEAGFQAAWKARQPLASVLDQIRSDCQCAVDLYARENPLTQTSQSYIERINSVLPVVQEVAGRVSDA